MLHASWKIHKRMWSLLLHIYIYQIPTCKKKYLLETLPPIAVVCSAGFTVCEACAGVECWLCRELLEPFELDPPSRGYGPLRYSSRCLRGLVGLPSYLLYRTEKKRNARGFRCSSGQRNPLVSSTLDLSYQNLLPVLSYNFQRKSTDGWQIRTLLLNALTSCKTQLSNSFTFIRIYICI